MKRFKLPVSSVPPDMTELLFVAWMVKLGSDVFSQHGSGGSAGHSRTLNFGVPDGAYLLIGQIGTEEWEIQTLSGVEKSMAEGIIKGALQKVQELDLGGDVVYQVEMKTHQAELFDKDYRLNFMRVLSDQVHVSGPRRLGDRVLLNFAHEEITDSPILFAPDLTIETTVIAPGPAATNFSQTIAAGMVELTSAICALATGRVVSAEPVMFPADDEIRDKSLASRADISILTLARDSISLDLFNEFAAIGGPEGVGRLRGALLSYHAALGQSNADIATMLFVTAIEAILAPNTPWAKERVTKRFVDGVQSLSLEAVDELLAHDNCEDAFNYPQKGGERARRKQLLERIYSLRSTPSHTGIGLSSSNFLIGFGDPGNMRVALLSDLARAAILSFIQAPRSFLTGHPTIDPPATAAA